MTNRNHLRSYLQGQGYRHYAERQWTVYPMGEGTPLHGFLLEIRVHKRGGVEIVQRTDPGTPGPRPVKWLAKFPATVPDFIVVSAAQSAIVGRFEEAKVAPS